MFVLKVKSGQTFPWFGAQQARSSSEARRAVLTSVLDEIVSGRLTSAIRCASGHIAESEGSVNS